MEKLIIELNSVDSMKIPLTIRMTMAGTMSMAFLVDHFVHCPFVKPLELILDVNSSKQ